MSCSAFFKKTCFAVFTIFTLLFTFMFLFSTKAYATDHYFNSTDTSKILTLKQWLMDGDWNGDLNNIDYVVPEIYARWWAADPSTNSTTWATVSQRNGRLCISYEGFNQISGGTTTSSCCWSSLGADVFNMGWCNSDPNDASVTCEKYTRNGEAKGSKPHFGTGTDYNSDQGAVIWRGTGTDVASTLTNGFQIKWPSGFNNTGDRYQVVIPHQTFRIFISDDGGQSNYPLYTDSSSEKNYFTQKYGNTEENNRYFIAIMNIPQGNGYEFTDGSQALYGENKEWNQYIAFLIPANGVGISETISSTNATETTVDASGNKVTRTSMTDSFYVDVENNKEYYYNNPVTSREYSGKTPPEYISGYKKTVNSDTTFIIKRIYYGMIWNGNGYYLGEVGSKYWTAGGKNSSHTIKYDTETPTITQIKYNPFNLNRNGPSQEGDNGLDKSFTNNTDNLNVSVDNKQNITNNSSIQTLDTNSDTIFKMLFNNNCFGMPSNFNWDNNISLANGTYEYADSSKSYCNGKLGQADSDECFRTNLNFNASISIQQGQNTASLVDNNKKETLGNSAIKDYYKNGKISITLGEMSARFIAIGDYTVDNTVNKSSNPKYWVNTYNQSKLYEYGTSFHGWINLSGVQSPDSVSHGNRNTSESITNIKINTNNKERGLYVGLQTESFEQPVFTAKWSVTSLAGTID